MGCDIHSFVEKKNEKGDWEKVSDCITLGEFDRNWYKKEKGDSPFDWRSYSIFAFLAGVRNYDHCDPISEPRGVPDDHSLEVGNEYDDDWGLHSASHLTIKELNDFNYDKEFWNRRISKQTGPNSWTGAGIAEEGEGNVVSYRENLGEGFFRCLKDLNKIGDPTNVRIVFWFDN
ncbi:MAG: hypothetical protein COB15_09535 [Flavobacteriales bacterium]|nr:MAG: hypothetical protein COB15_09535 [Flavobacteriales bacterium]